MTRERERQRDFDIEYIDFVEYFWKFLLSAYQIHIDMFKIIDV